MRGYGSSPAGAAEPAQPGRRRSGPLGGQGAHEVSDRGGAILSGFASKPAPGLILIRSLDGAQFLDQFQR
jgi:hypothetical protein